MSEITSESTRAVGDVIANLVVNDNGSSNCYSHALHSHIRTQVRDVRAEAATVAVHRLQASSDMIVEKEEEEESMHGRSPTQGIRIGKQGNQ